ncbi:hypothetical protein HMPREF2739_04860 [Staphylococcus sp. HMSC074F11]|nr:hypothetical protein HMPREF2739_04860 [Staphylococcus sp. HMSC074F11]
MIMIWFNKWFITYSIDLTVLLEKHYTSLNEEDVKLIANRINLLKKLNNDYDDIPENFYKSLNEFDKNDIKGKKSKN